jgi:hypothetical protein
MALVALAVNPESFCAADTIKRGTRTRCCLLEKGRLHKTLDEAGFKRTFEIGSLLTEAMGRATGAKPIFWTQEAIAKILALRQRILEYQIVP